MFLRNCWYVAAWDWEVRREALFRRLLLGDPVVLYRDQAGQPHALKDRCAHRHAPLSQGRLIGNEVECPYHGIRFNGDGQCTLVPSQKTIPPDANIRSYPVVERHRFIWIWMGDPALADPGAIDDLWQMTDPGWRHLGEYMHFDAHYMLLVDNLLDLTHLAFLHRTTLGTPAIAKHPIKTERAARGVRILREIPESPPPPLFAKLGMTGNVDRWQIVDYVAPSICKLDIGCAPAGQGGRNAPPDRRINNLTLVPITPETERTSHYFRTILNNYRLDDPTITQLSFEVGHEAVNEDQHMLREQQRMLDSGGAKPWVDFNQDAGGVQARRILESLLAAERPGA